MKRHIISGAPGTGKTTLINALQNSGYCVFEEVSRKIIHSQQQIRGNKTPWGDVHGFTKLVYKQTIKELNTPIKQHAFADRSLADSIPYLLLKKQPVPDYFLNFDYHKFYQKTVYFCPLWEEIFIQDCQRLQSFEESKELEYLLLNTYKKLGFSILHIPKTKVLERLNFIISTLK